DNYADFGSPGHQRSLRHRVRREPAWHALFLYGRRCRRRQLDGLGLLDKLFDFLGNFLDSPFVAHPFWSVEQRTKVSIQRSTHGAPPKSASPDVPREKTSQTVRQCWGRKMVPTAANAIELDFLRCSVRDCAARTNSRICDWQLMRY